MAWLFGGSIFASFLLFMIKIIISAIVAAAAWNKGRSFSIWFLYAYLMPVVAFIHVMILNSDEDGILYRKHMAICPECARPVDPDSTKCPTCKSDLTDKYLYVPSPPSETKVIVMIIIAVVFKLTMKFVTPDLLTAIAGDMGVHYETTVQNLQTTMEAFGVPRNTAALIAEKLSLAGR